MILVDSVAIIDHPFIIDEHVIALIVTETDKTVTVRYWDARKGDWGADSHRRKKDRLVVHNLGLRRDVDFHAIAEGLRVARDARRQAHDAAKIRYKETLKALAVK